MTVEEIKIIVEENIDRVKDFPGVVSKIGDATSIKARLVDIDVWCDEYGNRLAKVWLRNREIMSTSDGVAAVIHDMISKGLIDEDKIHWVVGCFIEKYVRWRNLCEELTEYEKYAGLAEKLIRGGYIRYITDETLEFMIKHKRNPNYLKKIEWIGSKSEATIFMDIFFLESYSIFNECFSFKSGELTSGNRGRKSVKCYPIYSILQSYQQVASADK